MPLATYRHVSLQSLRFPLEIGTGPKGLLVGTHALSAMAAWASEMSLWLQVASTAVIAASLFRESRRWRRCSGVLCYRARRGWSIERGEGHDETVEILNSTVVTPWVVFLHARGETAVDTWLLTAPEDDPDAFRRLRVCLRIANDRQTGRGT